MYGFNAIAPSSKKDQLAQRLTHALEDIRSRQLKKYKVSESSELIEQATTTFKHALIEKLMSTLDSSPCHLCQEYRLAKLEQITGL